MTPPPWRSSLLLAALLATALPADEPGNVVIVGESRPAAVRLDEARKRIADDKPAEAVALLQGIIDSASDDLVAVGEGRLVAARWLAQSTLARLDKDELARYRKRIDAQARRWLDEAQRTGRSTPLRRLADEAFCSPHALVALDRLGDQAFERGNFRQAEAFWQRIAPLDPLPAGAASADALVYPDPPADVVARAQAKQLLARVHRGQAGWKEDLDAYRRRHGKASGRLAGRTGAYADTLQAVAADLARRLPGGANAWPTFAGSFTRNRVAPAAGPLLDRLSQLCRAGPTWEFDLQERRARKKGEIAPPASEQNLDAARRLAFHPVVVGHVALVADARHVTAYDLRTGQSSVWEGLPDVGGFKPSLSLPTSVADLRCTLTVAEGCLFARMGTQTIRDIRPQPRRATDGESVLVSLSLSPGPDGRRRWLVRAIDPGRREFAVFEGAPVVREGRVYVAATRFEGDRVITAVHCYPAHPEDSTAPLLWRTDVCETRELLPAPPGDGEADTDRDLRQRGRHHLLTLAGSQVVYCSHSGAIVALDAHTGRRTWAVRYPRREGRDPVDDPALRDLAPCLFAAGRLYVAPTDSERLFCLDLQTGATLWQRDRLDVVHLVGVGSGRLIFTTWRNPKQGRLFAGGLRAVDAADGGDAGGWSLPDDGGGLIPFGRPLLAGGLVLWPTARRPYGVFAVRQSDGLQPDNPALLHRIPSGNLLYANGCLLVADERTLHAFVPAEMLPEEAAPDGKKALAPRQMLDRASAALGRGDVDQALAGLEDLEAAGQGVMRREPFRGRRREVLLAALRRDALLGKPDGVRNWLGRAAEGAGPEEALAIRVREAQAWAEAGRREQEAQAWGEVLGRPELARVPMLERGLPQRAGLVALGRLSQLGRAAGEDESKGAAAQRLSSLERAATGADEAVALAGLARSWEQMGCPRGADLVWQRLEEPAQPGASVPAPPTLGLPLRATLDLRLDTREDWLPLPEAEGPLAELLLSARPGQLVGRSRRSGAVVWHAPLAFTPTWAAGLGSLTLAGGPGGLAAVDADRGRVRWEMAAPLRGRYPAEQLPYQAIADPFSPEPFTEFHLVGSHLACLQGQRRLLCLDALTGRVLWQRWAPGAVFAMPAPRGRFQHVGPVGPERLLAQASGRRFLIDVGTGEALSEAPARLEPWQRRPVALGGDMVGVMDDPQRVDTFNAATGNLSWSYEIPGGAARSNEPPVVVPAGESVVVVEPLNVGYRVQKLDRATGKPAWPRPPLVRLRRLEPSAWLADEHTVWFADAGALTALSLADGARLWRRPLAGPDVWRLARAGRSLFAWAERGRAVRLQFRWLFGSVQWLTGPLPDDLGWSVECLDADSGELLQRINLDVGALRGRAAADWTGKGVPWPQATAEADAVSPGPRVVVEPGGLTAGVGDRVKVLSVDGSTPPR